ncbi:MAG: DUF4249 domain-containing protein [Cyclobacteriaceae bacterium]
MLRQIFYVVFFLLITSCIEEYQLNTSENPRLLVVNGQITDQPGPYEVELHYSGVFGQNSDFSQSINNAEVYLEDNEGNLEQMRSIGLGKYMSKADGIQGKIGNQYWLNITLPDGSSYRSLPETLLPVPEIDSLYYRIEEEIRYDPTNRPYTSIRFPIYASVADPVGTDNFYRWDWDAIEQIFTNVPSPPPIITSDTIVTTCYLIPSLKKSNQIIVAGDQFNNGNAFEQLIYKLPYDRSSHFLITIYQYSLTEKAYDYWQLVKQESRRSGSIFDPAPANVVGNIIPENNTAQEALGYFTASAVTSKKLLVDRSGTNATPSKIRLEGDCRYLYPGAYEEKPDGFK